MPTVEQLPPWLQLTWSLASFLGLEGEPGINVAAVCHPCGICVVSVSYQKKLAARQEAYVW